MKLVRPLVAATVMATTITAVIGLAAPAYAAAPTNDGSTGATAATLGSSIIQDTSAATTDAQDTQLNDACGAPATDASVWFSYTAASDGGVVVDVSSSDYSAGVLVGVGTPGALETVACAPGTTAFSAAAGTTYYVLAIDDQFDGGGNGGTLRISFAAAPPPPTVDFTVDPVGRVNQRTGSATLSGSFTCTNASFLDAFGDLKQSVGRFVIRGFFGIFADGSQCDGTPQRWSATVTPDNGKFAGGKAAAVTFTFACGAFDCAEGFGEHKVQLRR